MADKDKSKKPDPKAEHPLEEELRQEYGVAPTILPDTSVHRRADAPRPDLVANEPGAGDIQL